MQPFIDHAMEFLDSALCARITLVLFCTHAGLLGGMLLGELKAKKGVRG